MIFITPMKHSKTERKVRATICGCHRKIDYHVITYLIDLGNPISETVFSVKNLMEKMNRRKKRFIS